ncbi:MAG: Omp28-related outer membrane protein [Bacteroidetes bacterium]|nr:Omp28-related outer membrane protein [Bacteroidota bacterium]
MKRNSIILLLALLIIGTFSCKKDDSSTIPAKTSSSATLNPVQKQWGLVLEYTASWCGPCGQWGAPTMHDLCTSSSYVVGIANHASGEPMYNAALYSSFFNDRTDGGGIPSFWIGDVPNYQASTLSTLLAQPCKAAVDLNFTKTATTMTVNTQTKFFADDNGDYYLSVLVLESGIDGSASAPSGYKQNGTTDPAYTHQHVLRASAVEGSGYGESIIKGAVTAGQTINKSYTITLDASWTKTVFPVAVLWKYDASSAVPKYKFINCVEK